MGDELSEKLGLRAKDMWVEPRVTQALARYFEKKGFKAETEVQRYFPNSNRYLRVDLVLDGRIAIEVKTSSEMDRLVEGIGKVVLYLHYFEESWLAVPSIVMDVIRPALQILGSLPIKVLDLQRLELYEKTENEIRSENV